MSCVAYWCWASIWICYITQMPQSKTTLCDLYFIWTSRVTHEWVTSHILRYVARMNESCRTYEWVMSQVRTSNVTHEWVSSHMHESCHTGASEWSDVVPLIFYMDESYHTRISHVTYAEACRTYEWVVSHVGISRVAQVPRSGATLCYWYSIYTRHITHERVMSHILETCLKYIRMSRAARKHDSFV